jgi:hypothetical protein
MLEYLEVQVQDLNDKGPYQPRGKTVKDDGYSTRPNAGSLNSQM